MDYAIDHAINTFVRSHPLLENVLAGFASWGVTLFGVAAFALWLLDPPRAAGTYRRACVAGLSAAAVGLLVNQIIIYAWHRPRPYEAHPRGILPLITPSHDASFPSDHATAAFAIAFGVLFVARRTGLLFLIWASLIALSRVLVGAHYPTDVLAGLAVGLASGFFCARLLLPVLEPVIGLVGRITDPILAPIEHAHLVRSTLGSPRFRSTGVAVSGALLLVVFASRLEGPLFDEMPLATLALWALLVVYAARLARLQPANRRRVPS